MSPVAEQRQAVASDASPRWPSDNVPVAEQRQAVHASINKSINSKENQPRFIAIWTSLSSAMCQILRFGPELLRFSESRILDTETSQRSFNLRFPYGTGRRNTTGLPEQMPRCGGATSFGSHGPHRHKPTPLNLDRHSTVLLRTREVKAYVFALYHLHISPAH